MRNNKLASRESGSPWAFEMRHRLALALEVSGTSVAEMANELRVSPNTVGNYTSGRTNPKHATLAVWAMKTGAPLSWIETGIDPTVDPDPGANSNLRTSDYKVVGSNPANVVDLAARRALKAAS